jgi:hypothetical protein
MTCTGAFGSSSSSRRRAVGALTHTSASASFAATLIAREKNETLTRSWSSGRSKNVRSWIVTTLGTFATSGIV